MQLISARFRLCASLLTIGLVACSTNAGGTGAVPIAQQNSSAQSSAVAPLAHLLDYAPNVKRVCLPVAQTLPGHATCFALLRTDLGGARTDGYHGTDLATALMQIREEANAKSVSPVDPKLIQKAYNLPSKTNGSGVTVAVIDAFGFPGKPANLPIRKALRIYRHAYHLPACNYGTCFKIVNQQGKVAPVAPLEPTSDPNGWQVETSLDLEMVSAACPNCNILLIQTNSDEVQDLSAGEDTAANLGAKYISNSWGGSESEARDPHFVHPGVVMVASSGDDTWEGGVNEPAAFTTVVAVGGTSLYPSPTRRGFTEIAWAGGGSGCSTLVKRPTWQPSEGCASATKFDGRAEVDVAANADPNTGPIIYVDPYGWGVAGGTSAAAPVVAAAYALAGNAATVGSGAATIWKAGIAESPSLNHIYMGYNGYGCKPALICSAGPGYNGPTGWGTLNGVGAL